MKKVISENSVLFICAAFFLIFVFLTGSQVIDSYKYTKLAQTGIETTAEFVGIDTSQSLEVSGTCYYSGIYVFTDDKGVEHSGKTSLSFTYEELQNIQNNGRLLIVYNPETFESVEAGFSLWENKFQKSLFIITIVLIVIDSLFFVCGIVVLIRGIKKHKTSKRGRKVQADIVKVGCWRAIGCLPMYYIEYKWIDQLGNEHYAKTDPEYSLEVVEKLKQIGKIEIKVYGKKSTVAKDYELENLRGKFNIDNQSFETDEYQNSNGTIATTKKLCEYCEQEVNNNDKYCKHCGAKIEE